MTATDDTKPRALALLSGGLDSAIAIRLLLDQGAPVTALHFVSIFSPGAGKDGGLRARAVADELGVKLIVRDATRDMLEFVPNPRFGRGRNMNPCIDCRVHQLSAAKAMLEETGASYVVTGEVLGQRPMSQHRDAMKRIEAAAGLEGLLLRPLTAQNLEATVPEEKGWVDRERLLGISGRSRAEQNKLARMWGLKAHGTPAGGCLLTDRAFAWKLQDLLNYGDGLTANDAHLLKLGRHFRLGPRVRAIVGRNETENAKIVGLRVPGDWILVAAAGSSPETLLRGEAAPEHIQTAARLTARYSKHRKDPDVEMLARPVRQGVAGDRTWLPPANEERRLRVAAASEDEVAKLAIRRPARDTDRPPELPAAAASPAPAEPGADEERLPAKRPEPSAEEHLPATRPKGRWGRDRPGEKHDTFMGHLMELRARIIVCIVFLVLAMIAAVVFYKPLTAIIRHGVDDFNAARPEAARLKILPQRPTDGFIFVLKVGLLGGLALAFPMLAWQVWRFVSPGLYKREKMAVLPILTVGVFFFAGGCYFAHRFIMPLAMAYLYSFMPELGFENTVTAMYYMQFFLMIHVAFGIAFEMPLVILALAMLGLVTPGGLIRKWQYVIVGAFVIGAVLTPPDVLTQAMMGGSLIVLYIFSIVLAAIFGRRRPALEDQTDEQTEDGAGDGGDSPPAGAV